MSAADRYRCQQCKQIVEQVVLLIRDQVPEDKRSGIAFDDQGRTQLCRNCSAELGLWSI